MLESDPLIVRQFDRLTRHRPGRFSALNHSRMSMVFWCVLIIFAVGLVRPVCGGDDSGKTASSLNSEISFDRDIRPILSDNCFLCHGPDKASRATDLRLDTKDGLYEVRDDLTIVKPHVAAESELIRRILSDDEFEQMPPLDSNLKLTPEQKQKLQQWIAAGAPWSGHWAYEPIRKPAIPEIQPPAQFFHWKIGPLDPFIWRQFEIRNLTANPQADKAQLLRRLKFDLTGLPPTIEELDQFLADVSPTAYETMVDRFLASGHYGERMAWNWLDIARYADTNGYQGDRERTMWPWRDWVVRAFNSNLPYDRFTVMQLAGDLLPDATMTDQLATGFCRNHMINGEGGRIAEENRVEYVFDQTETMATVWLGLTMNCCRCHDHKYDQLSHQDYFQFYDFFNQTPVTGAGGNPQTAPNLAVPGRTQRKKLEQFAAQIKGKQTALAELTKQLRLNQPAWETEQLAQFEKQAVWQALQPLTATASKQQLSIEPDQAILASGPNPDQDEYEVVLQAAEVGVENAKPLTAIHAIRLDALRHPTMTQNGLARSDSGNFVLTDLAVELLDADEIATEVEIESAVATYEQGGLKVENVFDDDPQSGWAVLKGRFVDRDHAAMFVFGKPIEWGPDSRLRVRLKHNSRHRHHNLGHFRISATNDPAATIDDPALPLLHALRLKRADRSASQQKLIDDRFIESQPAVTELQAGITAIQKQRDSYKKTIPVVMVMGDRPDRRETFLLEKGIYNKPLAPARAAFPDWLPVDSAAASAKSEQSLNRLDLARWLVSPDNPLPARVTVNRYWQLFFGRGIVKTVDDFGVQGAKPTHPKLLEWLAADFLESGWDIKRLHKTIVMTAAYRQSSHVSDEVFEQDPDNSWLSRGPRSRLPSWMIRDQALAASGLLVDQIGGPPVKSYQPAGIWAEATFGKKSYQQESGDKLYRRTLYTFWRRIVGPTMLFDTSPRQVCSVQIYRTNTPLHALVTLNDVTYVEAARVMAERVLVEQSETDKRLILAMRLATSRTPGPPELSILKSRLEILKQQFSTEPEAAHELLQIGDFRSEKQLDPIETAAWASLCSLLLNLDEAISR